MGCFLPDGRLLVFDKCMDSQQLVSEIGFCSNTRFGIWAHKCIFECTVTTKVECNVVHMLRCRMVGGSTRYIIQNVKAGGSKLSRVLMIYARFL